jgi:kumamolisin
MSVITGSERQPVRGARVIRNSSPDQVIEVSVRLRPKSASKHAELKQALMESKQSSAEGKFQPMSRKEFEAAHGADPADLAQIKKFAEEYGLKVHETGTELARRTVVLSGTVAKLQKAFNVDLKEYSHPTGHFRGRTGSISAPAEYADIIQGVFGLDDRPQAAPHYRRLPAGLGIKAHAATISHDPNEVGQLYDFPPGDGSGQCIGIIELGGGFRVSDLNDYFSSLGINEPQVISVLVDEGTNSPSTPDSDDGEVMLDIEVAGAIAPAAKIVVYFAPNNDRGFLDALTTAVHDDVNQPSVISISWGNPEAKWTNQAMENFDQALQAAATMGVPVCCASGDNGSSDGINDGNNHVDFPASSPFALACGGTTFRTSDGQIVNEVVWNNQPTGGSGGGGVSEVFPLPSYQSGLGVPEPSVETGGRGVPDVAGDADPHTGYNILVDGEIAVFGGTSAVAPLWAGLVALMNERTGRPIGFLNPLIYSQAAQASGFRDITHGDNGSFSAATGWDPCTGLGSPDGAQLMAVVTGAPSVAVRAKSAAAKAGAGNKSSASKKPAA